MQGRSGVRTQAFKSTTPLPAGLCLHKPGKKMFICIWAPPQPLHASVHAGSTAGGPLASQHKESSKLSCSSPTRPLRPGLTKLMMARLKLPMPRDPCGRQGGGRRRAGEQVLWARKKRGASLFDCHPAQYISTPGQPPPTRSPPLHLPPPPPDGALSCLVLPSLALPSLPFPCLALPCLAFSPHPYPPAL